MLNLIGFVSGLLLICACVFSLSLRKADLSREIEKTYQSHSTASRKILSSYESLCYERLRGEIKEKSGPSISGKTLKKRKQISHFNSDCARLNLWPLVAEGREAHPVLYETAARLLATYYANALFEDAKRLEYTLLDALIASAKELTLKDPKLNRIPLETLTLKKANVKRLYPLQSIYYTMLKGTQRFSLQEGYPSLLDCFAIEEKKSKICLRHASIETLAALFGPRAAFKIFSQLHDTDNPLTIDGIRLLSSQTGFLLPDDSFFELIDLDSSCRNASGHKTLVQEDEQVRVKKKVFLPT